MAIASIRDDASGRSGSDQSAWRHDERRGQHRSRLLVVLGITVTLLVAELVGAKITGSLTLFADAGHMFTDVAGIPLAVLAVTFASLPATPERTFGDNRWKHWPRSSKQ